MSPTRASKKKLDEIQKVLSGLRGVKYTFYLTRQMRAGLGKIEKKYPSLGPLTVQNDGVLQCLKRHHVACIIKDKHFRAPPHATIHLVDEKGNIIGRELMSGEKVVSTRQRKVIMLGNDFAVFFEKGTGKGAHFVLPPVQFKEVAELDDVKSVCSSSPSTAGDFFLRRRAKLEDNPELASILVGFDIAGS